MYSAAAGGTDGRLVYRRRGRGQSAYSQWHGGKCYRLIFRVLLKVNFKKLSFPTLLSVVDSRVKLLTMGDDIFL